MGEYSVQHEAARILREHLLSDPKLPLHPSIAKASKNITFTGDDAKPFIPSPCKMTESASALSALVAAGASAIAADRYGIDYQAVEVNTDLATLFLESVILPTVKGQSFFGHRHLMSEVQRGDLYDLNKPIHRQATNLYKTRDGKFYHLHASMNAGPTMEMMGVTEQDVTTEQAIEIYAQKVAQHDAEFLETTANEKFKQAGVTCLTPEEFFESEQGKVMATEPLWTKRQIPAPKSAWPASPEGSGFKPLAGIRVIDFSRVIAAPVISKILAVLGAEVIKVTNERLPDISALWVDLSAGKRDANIDLKTEEGKKQFENLVKGADVLIDGYRPGSLAKLGFDGQAFRKLKPTLIHVRENCYGFKGPLANRSGWQQISDCMVGIAWLQGRFLGLDEPVVPLLPNSDYQVGLVGAAAVLEALLQRTKSGATYDIDVSLTQYNIWYYRLGQYDEVQSKAILARNEGFKVRHFDEMQSLLGKTHAAIQKARPDLFRHAEYFWRMSGKEWGMDDEIAILAPAFKFNKSKLEYTVPSGSRGRSKPEWESSKSRL